MRIPAQLVALSALGLAACSSGSEPASDETAVPAPASTASVAALPASSPTPTASARPSPDPVGLSIPAALHGKWARNVADCPAAVRTDTRALLTVTAAELRFYESVAEPKAISQSSSDALRGQFAFSGEGMEWVRELSLRLAGGGNQLVLEEFGTDAPAGPRSYTRCP